MLRQVIWPTLVTKPNIADGHLPHHPHPHYLVRAQQVEEVRVGLLCVWLEHEPILVTAEPAHSGLVGTEYKLGWLLPQHKWFIPVNCRSFSWFTLFTLRDILHDPPP